MEEHYEFTLLLNNDTKVRPDFIEALEKRMDQDSKGRIFALSSKMVKMHDPLEIDDAGDAYTLLGWQFQHGLGECAEKPVWNREAVVFSACAGAAMYRTALFRTVGLFDEHHFAYLEDIDVSYRAQLYGYRVLYCPMAVVEHVGSGTSGSKYNAFKVRLSARNSVYLLYKNMPALMLLVNVLPLLLGFLVSIVAILFNEHVVPWANTAYRNVVYYEIQGNSGAKSQDHIILKDIKDGQIQRLLYARRYDADSQSLQSITLQEFDGAGKVSHVENAEYAEFTGKEWVMHNGMLYDISDGESEHTLRFNTQVLPINASPRQIVREQKNPEELTMKELKAQIRIMKTQYVDTSKLETELYQRITVPMASLIFALVGVPLGLQPTRNSSSAGFAMSVIIIFFYYALMTMANAIGRSGALSPMLAVWIPNVVGLIAGLFLIRKASR